MRVTKSIIINLSRRQPTPVIDAVQGDSARQITFDLYCNELPWSPPEGAQALIRYRRPDGSRGLYDTLPNGERAYDIQDHTITVCLVQTLLATPGTVFIQVSIVANGDILSTFPLQVRVAVDPAAGVVAPEDYVNIQNWMEAEVEKLKAELDFRFDELNEKVTENFNAKAEELETQYSYVAEDPNNDGNVVLRPFNLGGLTDTTLTKPKVPADAKVTGERLTAVERLKGYGLGGDFPDDKEYTAADLDTLTVPGWYRVSVYGQLNNIEINAGALRVDGDGRGLARQTLYAPFDGVVLERDSVQEPWYCANPPYIPGKPYLLAEQHNGQRVHGLMVDLGYVGENEVGVLLEDIEPDMVIVGAERFVKYPNKTIDVYPELEEAFDFPIAWPWITDSITLTAPTVDTDGDGLPDASKPTWMLKAINHADFAVRLRYLIKYTNGDAWRDVSVG